MDDYWVICRDDIRPGCGKGKYVLARSRPFRSEREAQHYAASVSFSREARVLVDVVAVREEREIMLRHWSESNAAFERQIQKMQQGDK